MKKNDSQFMKQAVALAKKGGSRVSPNPRVGAVVARAGKVVGRGFHAIFGGPHAEVAALGRAGKKAKGATLYVTLEPCSTFGKTPPCVDAIAASGVKRVVMAIVDPNPRHRGKGIAQLRRRGIRVEAGIEEAAAKELILGFRRWITRKVPYVIAKEAMTLDGKIATRTGDSRWVSGAHARRWVHRLRGEVDAILVGKKTAILDDPQLTARFGNRNGNQPARIVLAADGVLPSRLKLFSPRLPGKTWIAVNQKFSARFEKKWEPRGVRVLPVKNQNGSLSIPDLLKQLGRLGVTSLLVEGGGETVGRFFEAKAVDKLCLFVAPKIVGGRAAVTPVEGTGFAKMAQALSARRWKSRFVGKDMLIEVEF